MTFPALTPSARTYVPGGIPASTQTSLSGARTGFRRGNRTTNQTLSLGFLNLTESQVNEIKAHFIDRQGTFDLFFLPTDVWSGYTTAPVAGLSNTAWRYAQTPTITDGIVGRWSVDVELTSYGILQGDLDNVGPGSDPATPVDYIYDALTASATPARTYLIDPGAS